MSAPKLPTLYAYVRDDGFVIGAGEENRRLPGMHSVAYVPESALEEANEALRLERAENVRLQGVILAAANAIRNEINPSNHDDECQLDEESVEMAIIVLRAALTPKESADV